MGVGALNFVLKSVDLILSILKGKPVFRFVILLALVWSTVVWAVAPRPQVKTAGEVAWEAIPDTIPDAEQVRVAREYLDKYPNEIPLLRSVQNILNRKSDLTEEFWKARMDENPTSANRYLWARKTGDSGAMKEQGEWIIAHDPENFWGYYLFAVSEMNKEKPDQTVVLSYLDQAIAKDPSRMEGWYYAADANEQAGNLDKAVEYYRAAMVVDSTDKTLEMSVMGIYARKHDADAYFSTVSKFLQSEPPLAMDLERYNTADRFKADKLLGDYTVLEVFAYWCNPCVKGALPEMNKRATEGTLPFRFWAVHAEGKNEGGLALMDSNDVKGLDWKLNFVFSTPDFNKRLGITAYPSYVVIDDKGRPVAMLVGHSESTIDLLEWLIIEARKRS